jgi:hypothetical protein
MSSQVLLTSLLHPVGAVLTCAGCSRGWSVLAWHPEGVSDVAEQHSLATTSRSLDSRGTGAAMHLGHAARTASIVRIPLAALDCGLAGPAGSPFVGKMQ